MLACCIRCLTACCVCVCVCCVALRAGPSKRAKNCAEKNLQDDKMFVASSESMQSPEVSGPLKQGPAARRSLHLPVGFWGRFQDVCWGVNSVFVCLW